MGGVEGGGVVIPVEIDQADRDLLLLALATLSLDRPGWTDQCEEVAGRLGGDRWVDTRHRFEELRAANRDRWRNNPPAAPLVPRDGRRSHR